MSLVNKDEMTQLRPASEATQTAKTAEDDIQLQAVAFAINQASNTGLYRVIFQEALRENVKSQLESNGYTVRQADMRAYDQGKNVEISWPQD